MAYSKSIFSTGKCAHSHKPMPVVVNGETLFIYGGAAGSPVYKDCDIFVALDGSTHEDKAFYPWNTEQSKVFISFYITDMQVPKDRVEFRKMIEWLKGQILMGRKVHVGCMGGHGRTGIVLAALVKVLTGESDAITYVRKNYCHKAVETSEQANFLKVEYGITPVAGTKLGGYGMDDWLKGKKEPVGYYPSGGDFNKKYPAVSQDYTDIEPLSEVGSIWFSSSDSVDVEVLSHNP